MFYGMAMAVNAGGAVASQHIIYIWYALNKLRIVLQYRKKITHSSVSVNEQYNDFAGSKGRIFKKNHKQRLFFPSCLITQHSPMNTKVIKWRHFDIGGSFKAPSTRPFLQQLVRGNRKPHQNSAVLTLCERNPPATDGFPSQRASYVKNLSIRVIRVSRLHRNPMVLASRSSTRQMVVVEA